jgi:GTP-binding protein Era
VSTPGFRSGVVAIVGRPNVGKSTLTNALVGQKVAIVSDKPQTTRADIRAIWTIPQAQVVFTDTPGFHKPSTALGARLNDLVGDAVEGTDLIVHVVDALAGVGRGDAFVYERQVRPAGAPAICVVNKIDGLRKDRVVTQLSAADALGDYREIVPVSATRGEGVGLVRDLVLAQMPEGPKFFPDEEVTDQLLDVRLSEMVREAALRVTRQEVPHSIAVVIDEREDPEEGSDLTRIHASLIVERDSQKGIVIGKGGATLRTIGTQARSAMEDLLGTRVYLDLHVKVMKEWQRDPKALERLGF